MRNPNKDQKENQVDNINKKENQENKDNQENQENKDNKENQDETRKIEIIDTDLNKMDDKLNEDFKKLPQIGETRYINQFYYNGINKVPKESESSMRSWYRYFPKHYWRLWDDKSFTFFVKENYPRWFITYKKLISIEQKSNFAQYLLLFHFGGIFSHTDVEYVMGDYQSILSKSGIVLFESSVSPIKYLAQLEKYELDYILPWERKKKMFWIRSRIMASIPRHPFWLFVLSGIARNVTSKKGDYLNEQDFISCTTGDIFLSLIFEKYKHKFINIYVSQNNFIALPIMELKKFGWNIENKIDEIKDYIAFGKKSIEEVQTKKLNAIDEKRKIGNFLILDKEDFFFQQRYNFHYFFIIAILSILIIIFFVSLFYEKPQKQKQKK